MLNNRGVCTQQVCVSLRGQILDGLHCLHARQVVLCEFCCYLTSLLQT